MALIALGLYVAVGWIETVENVLAFLTFVLERGAPVFELLTGVLIVFSIIRYFAPEGSLALERARDRAVRTIFPPSRESADDAGGDAVPLLPENQGRVGPSRGLPSFEFTTGGADRRRSERVAVLEPNEIERQRRVPSRDARTG